MPLELQSEKGFAFKLKKGDTEYAYKDGWRFAMKKSLDVLTWAVALFAIGVAVWQFLAFMGARDGQGHADITYGLNNLWVAIAAIVLACASIVVFLVRHPRHEEEIHVTR